MTQIIVNVYTYILSQQLNLRTTNVNYSRHESGGRAVKRMVYQSGGPGVTGQNNPLLKLYPGIVWPRPKFTPGYKTAYARIYPGA